MSKRFITRPVLVGNVAVGGDNPIRIQSMTTSPTHDVEATTQQIMRLADHGCEIARVTVQGMKEARACEAIKNCLIQAGYTIPLVADIHFFPKAALVVADFVDKVRINPGNFVDKRATFQSLNYDELAWQQELDRIEETLLPLLVKCQGQNKSIRIGVNHGSLSDRIMTRFGNTPRGMVESALEYTEVARRHNFHDIIFSMKASNPLVMIAAYRLLVVEMEKRGWDYPLHLGVTEAGEGEDGRVKSAVGIGALLQDGIGDTIRVSLTEDPWLEIDPCQRLAAFAKPFRERQTPYVSFTDLPKPLKPTFSKDLPLNDQGAVLAFSEGTLPEGHKPDLLYIEEDPRFIRVTSDNEWDKILTSEAGCILFAPKSNRVEEGRRFFRWLNERAITLPVILDFTYNCSEEDLVITASAECGALLTDGLGEGLLLCAPVADDVLISLSFSILQACRKRLTKTEFISCPSCGRTLFNIQEVSKKIRTKTAHLPGVKIAIMGCIVNGPGEMADADFGYVGAGTGKIDLYVGHTPVKKGILEEEALDQLISLIKSHNQWTDK